MAEPTGKEKIKTIREWLDLVKELSGAKNDEELGAVLGVFSRSIRFWRSGTHMPGVKHCWTIGRALGVNPLLIVLCAEKEQAIKEGRGAAFVRSIEALARPIAPWEPKRVKSGLSGREGENAS